MKIDANLAVIKTAQVEIKALTVSGKQVTLAVFRQLDKKEIIDYRSKKLNGMAWGRVNYCPDNCQKNTQHIHIIWQEESTLYRDTLYLSKEGVNYSPLHRYYDAYQKFENIILSDQELVLHPDRYEEYPDLRREQEEFLDKEIAKGLTFYRSVYKQLENLDLLFIAV